MSPTTRYLHSLLKKISDLRLIIKHLRVERKQAKAKELSKA